MGPLNENAGWFISPQGELLITQSSVMDLYRFATPFIRDWTLSNSTKYFSVDNGLTAMSIFSNGLNYQVATGSAVDIFGDGRQASHWKDNLGLGIMDPTAGAGELLTISANDIAMMDVLGWDRVTQPVPEASTVWAGMAFISLGAFEALRRRRVAARSR